MTGKTETRLREIRSRTRKYRKQYEIRLLACLKMFSLLLLTGIVILFRSLQDPGIVDVSDGYCALLLRDGAGAYVVIGVAAFVIGAAVTLICIRLKNKTKNFQNKMKESEKN